MNTLYIVDNFIYYYSPKRNNTFKIKFTNGILKNGKVANALKFLKIINKLLQEQKLINMLWGENVTCIVNASYTNADKYLLTQLLEKINFKKVVFINEINLLNLKNQNYISYNKEYMIIYYINKKNQKNFRIVEKKFFPSEKTKWDYINNLLTIKKIYIYGEEKFDILNKIVSNLKLETFIIDDTQQYIINQYTK